MRDTGNDPEALGLALHDSPTLNIVKLLQTGSIETEGNIFFVCLFVCFFCFFLFCSFFFGGGGG